MAGCHARVRDSGCDTPRDTPVRRDLRATPGCPSGSPIRGRPTRLGPFAVHQGDTLYYTYVTGEIRIEPPLTLAECRASRFSGRSSEGPRAIMLDAREQPPQRTVGRVLPDRDDAESLGQLEDDVQELIDAFPGHEFRGRFQCMGDGHWDDMWGVVVIDGCARRVTPRVIWPDEEAESSL
ncbi:hypothetical protein GCM10010289_72160 [Streptomyces violascens]|nr:hypothetical protein GCM10010289_72160 [Streptomyces violascens]